MFFIGITRVFSLQNEEQYNTIGSFWDEMSEKYGLENLQGLGFKWTNNQIYYAIGLKEGEIEENNSVIDIPDDNWIEVNGKTKDLQQIYDNIYKNGPLDYELEYFYENGDCKILYYRK